MSPYFIRLREKITKKKILLHVKRFVIVSGSSFLLFLLLNMLFPVPDKIEYATVITDSKGEVVNAFLTSDDKWRMRTELGEISPLLKKTIIAKEDKYFYSHPGINIFAIGRAAAKNLLRGKRTSGASTITMQVARALEPGKRNLVSKLREAFRALQLEWKYDKDEILQMYLNLVPYGGNLEGVKAASLLYFRKNPDHLSLAEITALSIIPNRPSSLVIGKNNDLIVKERNRWLQKFADDGVFTKQEIEDAIEEPLHAARHEVPHHIRHLSLKLKTAASSAAIATNIVMNTQLKIETMVQDYIRTLKLKNINNAAVVVIDNRTHKVVSYIGSSNFFDTTDAGQVNGAAAIRQPGSTLKPLLYALAFDEGLITPRSVIADVPVSYNGYAPENYDLKFNGAVTVEYALEHSLNIPSVKVLKDLGKNRFTDALVACNFRQIQKDQNKLGLSMILGGCGTTLEELTGLFSAFANHGTWVQPQLIASNQAGKKVQVVSPAAAFMVTEILSKVNRPDFPLTWTATERMPKIAWKTGTSYGRRDAWSIGYNKNYTVGVWVGNFSGVGVAELSGANTATPLLFRIFNTIDYDSNTDWYSPPKECDLRKVCTVSGLPPGLHCTSLVTDYFIPLTSSTASCTHMQEVKIAANGQISFCESCAPAAGFVKKLFNVITPEMQEHYITNGIPFQAIPKHNPECEKIFRGEGPVITSPMHSSEYFINRKDPEPLQLSAKTPNDVSKLYWYINDRFYKSCSAKEKLFFVPEEGLVKISCTDDKGRNRNIRITVKYANL